MRRCTARQLAVLLLLILVCIAFSGCGSRNRFSGDAEIVCTIFPLYDWTKNVLGDAVAAHPVRLLSENGNDPHNYQPTVSDIIEASNSALLIAVGGISDVWVEEIAMPQGKTLFLIDEIELCEAEHDHTHGEAHDHDHNHSEIDEHFWLSLSNARRAVEVIAEALSTVYPEEAESFRENARRYTEQLDELDSTYRNALKTARHDTILVADRFPFLYLTEAYGIRYEAAFPGCSAESETSFAIVVSLAERLRELRLPAVLVTETGDFSLPMTVIRTSEREGVVILTLHSCQSVSRQERENGTTYLSIMEANLEVLVMALGGS